MKENMQLSQVKEILNKNIEMLYKSAENDLYQNYRSAYTLNNIYQKLTGENVFKQQEFLINNLDYSKIIESQNDKILSSLDSNIQNNLETFKQNNLLTDSVLAMNNFIKSIIDDVLSDSFIKTKIKLSDEEQREIINGFLSEYNFDNKDIYDKLKEESRIVSLKQKIPSVRALTYTHSNTLVHDDSLIFINDFDNDFYKLNVLVHELGHAIELENLKKELSPEKFLEFQKTSLFTETNSINNQLRFLNFLTEQNYPQEEIKNIRTKELTIYSSNINSVYLYLKDNFTDEKESMLDNFGYMYGYLVSIYLDSIKKDNDLSNVFDQEKLNVNGPEMFEKIDCDSKKLTKAINMQIKKCRR